MSDEDFIEKKRIDYVYVSKPFVVGVQKDREARYITRVFEEADRSCFEKVDDEIVLRATHNDKVQVKAVVTSDDHRVQTLTLQSFRLYKKEGWSPEQRYGINLHGKEIAQLLQFLELATRLNPTAPGRLRIDEDSLGQFDIDAAVKDWIKRNPQALTEIAAHQITTRDIVAVGYRKAQLGEFTRLLEDTAYFDNLALTAHHGSPEAVWQAFFERNRWIFGYGLFYLSAAGIDNHKLEQAIAGATIAAAGKRADALLRTRGRVSSVCLVEIKHHRTPLLKTAQYRGDAWPPSAELTGAIAQTLANVDGIERDYRSLLSITDEDGNPTGEEAMIARPRAVVVCGSLSEFVTEHGINYKKFRCFELHRRHQISPEIITFDELFERARLVVESTEEQACQ